MKFFRRNMKTLVFFYLLFCIAPVAFAANKPSFLAGAGDAEQKADNLIKSLIDWASTIAIGIGSLGIIAGGIMLVPVLGQQQRSKFFFLGGGGAIVFGVAGLSIASWLFEKIS